MTDAGALAPLWLVVLLLAAFAALEVLANRGRVPASVVLVLLGLTASLLVPVVTLPISPELLLAIVLPGLVFEAAFRTDAAVLRPTAGGIFLLGVPGVLVVAAIVAVLLVFGAGFLPLEAFVVGAIVAATDPAAVLSAFRRLRVPPRLAMTVEMESIVNDGTGIVLFVLALDLLTGHGSAGGAAAQFVVSVVGSVLVGAVLGWLATRLIRRVDDHLAELTITIVLAYGSYLAAATVGWSGVIATLVAAGIFGATVRPHLTQLATDSIDTVWELVAFLLTAAVFLLIGVSITASAIVHAAVPIAWGIAAVVISRAVVVFGLFGGVSRLAPRFVRPLPTPWLSVVFWAGLRGAVSVALALSLPAGLPNRDILQGTVFGIVLFTLLVQGTTIGWVVRRSGADGPSTEGATGEAATA